MHHSKFIPRSLRYILSNIGFRTATLRDVMWKNNNFVKPLRFCTLERCRQNSRSQKTNRCYLALYMPSLFTYFFHDEEESEENAHSEIIRTLKKAKLLIQKQEFDKAEQMLHIALHQAQTINSYQSVTYVYDVMANLAFETENYTKAEPLFVAVLNRLITTGTLENDLKVIHISLKMAKIFEIKREMKKSEQGYKFCIEHLQSHLKEDPEDEEAENMLLITFGWYAQMLTQVRRYVEAYDYSLQAYNISRKLYGDEHERTAVMLNELGATCYVQENYNDAIKYFSAAIEIARKQNMLELCEFLINLGDAYLKQGLYNEATKFCEEGRKIAKKGDDADGLHEANACLQNVKKLLKIKSIVR